MSGRSCVDCDDRRAVAKGRCMRCYKRHRAGRPSIREDRTQLAHVGQRDGHGLYGVLDNDGDTVLCHECGRRLRALGSHIVSAHGMTAAEYRTAHGLPRGQGLVSRAVHEAQSARASSRVGTAGWARLEAARDPAAAAAARTWDRPAPAIAAESAERARVNGRRARRGVVRTCPHCAAQWCPLPGGYQRQTCGAPDCRTGQRRAAGHAAAVTRATRQYVLTPQDHERLRTLTGRPLLDLLRGLRARGATQSTMARAAGRSEAAVSRALSGHRVPSLDRPR